MTQHIAGFFVLIVYFTILTSTTRFRSTNKSESKPCIEFQPTIIFIKSTKLNELHSKVNCLQKDNYAFMLI